MRKILSDKEIRLKAGLFTQVDVSRMIGVDKKTWKNDMECGKFPRPTRRWKNHIRRHYNKSDLKIIKQYYRKPRTRLAHSEKAFQKGLFSIVRACKYLKVPLITFRSWLDIRKILPYPKHIHGVAKYYTKAELDGFRKDKLVVEYFKKRKSRVVVYGRKKYKGKK